MTKPETKSQKKTRNGFSPEFWMFLGILALAAFLRFYKLSQLFHWTLDEEFWSYIPWNIATGYHLPLIGGNISGTGLYSGPLFVWLVSPFFFLFRGEPLGVATLVSSLGILTVATTYLVGKSLFGTRAALFAILLQASSFLMTIYDRKYWNASPIPLLSLLTLFSIQKIALGERKWLPVLALVLALASQAHMTSAVLLLFVPVSWMFLKLPLKKKDVVVAFSLFLFLQLPLLVFDLRHQWLNTKAALAFFTRENSSISWSNALADAGGLTANTAGRLLFAPRSLDLANELTLCPGYASARFPPPIWSMSLAGVSFIGFLLMRNTTYQRLPILLIAVNFLALVWYRRHSLEGNWYPGALSEYFLFPSFPMLFLILGNFFSKLSRRRWGSFIIPLALLGLAFLNSAALTSAQHSDGFAKKDAAVNNLIQAVAGKPFAFTVESSDTCRLYGYRYLLTVRNTEPVQSYLDPQLNWLYERRLPEAEPEKAAAIIVGSDTISVRVTDVSETR